MTTRRFFKPMRALTLSAVVVLPIFSQIAQDRPELCGKPQGLIPLPHTISAEHSGTHMDLAIELDGREAKIELSGVQEVDEVCPLDGNRFLVFTTMGAGDSTIFIVSGTTGALLDSFVVQTPAVSPDQHWLAMRDWIIPISQIPRTEQYLLYDLTKDAAANRQYPGAAPGQALRYGRTMYPATPNHVPFENHGVRADQLHSFPGRSFYWAEDSKSVLFTDSTDEGLKIVLVRVGDKDLAYWCTQCRLTRSAECSPPLLSTVPRYGVTEVQATFSAEAWTPPVSKVLTLHDRISSQPRRRSIRHVSRKGTPTK